LGSKIVSVLIPTYNAEKYIKSLISRLLDQQLDEGYELEIIIVDSSSTDNTVSILLKDYPEVIVKTIPNSNFDHGGTRNYLASLAKGEFLLYMTQDAIPYDSYLIKNLLKPFNNPEVLISYAKQVPKEDASVLETFARNFNYPDHSIIKNKNNLHELGIKTFFNSNVCSMYRRICFQKFSGFPEKIILNEDMVLASKVILNGFSVSYTAEAKVYHSHNYNLTKQFKRYFDIGIAFEQTSNLLKYVSNEKEGIRMVKEQLKFLINQGEKRLIPFAILETGVKFIGYNLGKRHKYLPDKLKRKWSAYLK
jgi:rhamnosyltransferase